MSKRRGKTKDDRASASGARAVPTLKRIDYLGINHKMVNEKINPNVEFRCYMSVTSLSGRGRYPAAVYFDPKPNRELNHSDYMLIHSALDPITLKSSYYITGRTQEQIDKDRIHTGTLCLECNEILVSLDGHHFHGCDCPNEMFVDGGQASYTRVGAKDLSKTQDVKVDMLTGEIKVDKPRRKR